jgi:hypothetical protein
MAVGAFSTGFISGLAHPVKRSAERAAAARRSFFMVFLVLSCCFCEYRQPTEIYRTVKEFLRAGSRFHAENPAFPVCFRKRKQAGCYGTKRMISASDGAGCDRRISLNSF